MTLNLNGVNKQLKAIIETRRAAELTELESKQSEILEAMSNAELELVAGCDTFAELETLPPDFLQKWGDDIDRIEQLATAYWHKWGISPAEELERKYQNEP